MTIVDAHHHLWDTEVLNYKLFDTVPELRRPYRIGDYERVAAANGVVSSVCVEAASAGADGWDEAMWLLDEVSRSRIVTSVTAWAPLEAPGLATHLQRLKDRAGDKVLAIRRSFEFEASDFPERAEVIAGVKLVARFGYKFELVLFERSLESALRLIQACPETEFILDHAGKPRIREGIDQPWKRNISAIAKHDNVVCKISGLSTEADRQTWRKEHLKGYIEHAIESFGWNRILFGSDWPVCNLARGFERWLEAALWATASASEEDRQKLLAENARRVYASKRTERQHAV
jgi:L-fuconolactonase